MKERIKFDPRIHGRHSIRVPEYDYASTGFYFITICVQDRRLLFGRIRDERMELNGLGRIARDELLKTPSLRPNVRIDAWVIMPDHVHVVVNIRSHTNHQADVGAWRAMPLPHDAPPYRERVFSRPQPDSVPTIVGAFKSAVTKRIHQIGFRSPVWQRNYHERIVRDQEELNYYRGYIRDNPKHWK